MQFGNLYLTQSNTKKIVILTSAYYFPYLLSPLATTTFLSYQICGAHVMYSAVCPVVLLHTLIPGCVLMFSSGRHLRFITVDNHVG